MRRAIAPALFLLALLLVVVGCGGSEQPSARDEAGDMARSDEMAGDGGMGGEGAMLGGRAHTRELARASLARPPEGSVAWVAIETRLAPGERYEHFHRFAFVHAVDGPHTLDGGRGIQRLEPGQAAAVQTDVRHAHIASDDGSVFWHVMLAPPRVQLSGIGHPRRVWASEPLEGIPDGAVAVAAEVELPASGGATSVHAHPGPETVYAVEGTFDYETGTGGTTSMGPGDVASLPPGVAVQKRNDGAMRATFLSWFLVDPDEPFAAAARLPSADGPSGP